MSTFAILPETGRGACKRKEVRLVRHPQHLPCFQEDDKRSCKAMTIDMPQSLASPELCISWFAMLSREQLPAYGSCILSLLRKEGT